MGTKTAGAQKVVADKLKGQAADKSCRLSAVRSQALLEMLDEPRHAFRQERACHQWRPRRR